MVYFYPREEQGMPVIAIGQATIQDREKLSAYAAKAGGSLGAHGAKVLAFDEAPDVIEGSVANKRTIVIEFESREDFDAWYNSPEYQAALPLRLEAAPGSLILVNRLPGDSP